MWHDSRGPRSSSRWGRLLQGDSPPGGGQGEIRAFDGEEGASYRPRDRTRDAGKGTWVVEFFFFFLCLVLLYFLISVTIIYFKNKYMYTG